MNKLVAYLAFILIGIGIGYLLKDCGGDEPLIDPQIHRLNLEIGWRELKEKKIKDSLNTERKEKKAMAKENEELRSITNKAIARYKEVKQAIPLTHNDTIVFLMRDTVACDSALLRSQELVQGLTKEIINDNKELAHSDSLNANLEMDKRDLKQADSLHVEREKSLNKKIRKARLKFLGIGGVLGVVLALVF